MAIGPQTQAALNELAGVISNEVSEFAEYTISVTGADADTAAAIRAKLIDVQAIVTKFDPPEVDETPVDVDE